METWFTSDLHFGHDNIIGFCDRPYDTAQQMDEALIANWNERVAPADLVYVVGDLCMGRLEHTLGYVNRLHGRKVLIAGNHDRCWQGRPRYDEWIGRYIDAGIEAVVQTGAGKVVNVDVGGRDVQVSHFPFVGDKHEQEHGDKFSAWRPDDEGQWLIHGHVHDRWLRNGRQINVSVDVWDYAPVNADWLAEMIADRDVAQLG